MGRRFELDDLIALPAYQSVALSPGRDRLALTWNPEGRSELYVMDLRHRGPPRRLSSDLVPSESAVGISWLDDGSIVVAVDLQRNERHTLVRLLLDTEGARTLLGGDARYQLGPTAPTGQELLVSSDRDGPMSLFVLNASDRLLRQIASLTTPSAPGCWSPDGQWIYVAASDAADPHNEDIYRVRRDGRVRECIFSSGTGSRDRPIRATPDGRSLVIATDRSGFMQPAILDLGTGAARNLGDGTGDESPADLSPDGRRILNVLSRDARTSLVEINTSNRRRRTLALPSGVLSDARYLWDGRILSGHADPRHRPRLLAWAPEGSPVERSGVEVILDAEYGRLSPDDFADGEVLAVRSEDGLEIENILYRPATPPSTRAPAIVLIHGGPDLHDTLTFNPEVQALVSGGFAVLQVNYRGSTGRGREFLDLNIGDLGGGDADDVAAGARRLARDPGIDPARILCAGGSYGGYLTYRSLTRHPEFWAGGAAWFGITDWTRLYQESTAFLRHYLRLWFGGAPDEVPDRYQQASPIHDIRRLRSPLLILHGKTDPRVPVGQARALRRGLLEAGRLEGRDFVYHELDVGHGALERDARLTSFTCSRGSCPGSAMNTQTGWRAVSDMGEPRRIGVLVGREESFPIAFAEEVNRRRVDGVVADLPRLGGTRMDEAPTHAVLIDRISHEVPYYRAHLKYAALAGTAVINNPFWWSADEKFFGTAVMARLDVAVPKTVVLPNKAYIEDISPESLRNLTYPLNWEAVLDYVGLPAILKPNVGGGFKQVYLVRSLAELWSAYDQTGRETMILQEYIAFEHYVRCLCVGREHILPIRWDPRLPWTERYIVDHEHLSPALGERVIRDARLICETLGYDMNTVEFAVHDGVPYAIDFLNPAPDFERVRIREPYFAWVVQHMADLAIAYAVGDRPAAPLRWDRFLARVGNEA